MSQAHRSNGVCLARRVPDLCLVALCLRGKGGPPPNGRPHLEKLRQPVHRRRCLLRGQVHAHVPLLLLLLLLPLPLLLLLLQLLPLQPLRIRLLFAAVEREGELAQAQRPVAVLISEVDERAGLKLLCPARNVRERAKGRPYLLGGEVPVVVRVEDLERGPHVRVRDLGEGGPGAMGGTALVLVRRHNSGRGEGERGEKEDEEEEKEKGRE